MILFSTLISAFIMGFLGSAHCLGMCGGITIALNQSLDKKQHLRLSLIYQLFRIVSYGILGALVASIGMVFNQWTDFPILIVFGGLLMIMLGFYMLSWWSILSHLESLGRRLWKKVAPIQKKFIPIKKYHQAMIIGLLWGLLPCGLVYSALAMAATSNSTSGGALSMMAFGLGTLPALFLAGVLSHKFLAWFKKPAVRAVIGILFIVWGSIQIYASFNQNQQHQQHQHHHHAMSD